MEENKNIIGEEKVNLMFDCLLIQTVQRGITYEEFLEINSDDIFFGEFQQLSSWNQKYGYKFNVYNDHLINNKFSKFHNKKHFHLDNNEKNVHLKLDFDGNILESIGEIDKKVYKVLKKFLQQESVSKELNQLWDKNNSTNE